MEKKITCREEKSQPPLDIKMTRPLQLSISEFGSNYTEERVYHKNIFIVELEVQ